MARTRRAAIDGGFNSSGSDWDDSFQGAPFTVDGYAEFTLPFTMNFGGNGNSISTVTIWKNGVVSLGPPTQAQIDFFASGASPIPWEANPGFPGEFFLFDYEEGVTNDFFTYGIGRADYNAPYESADAVSAAFFSFENGFQIILDQYGFSILSEFGNPNASNGYFIGAFSNLSIGFELESDSYGDLFTYDGTPNPDNVLGSDFNDLFRSSGGADSINGFAGIDRLSYEASPAGVTVNLGTGAASGGDAAGDQVFGIEDLVGSNSSDTLTGSGGNNRLLGGGGVDTINGGGGNDEIEGGAEGDVLDGGAGFDILSYVSSSGGVHISLVDFTADGGDATGDTFQNFEEVVGSNHDDILQASAFGNTLSGQSGNDTLLGLSGADFLEGGYGDDFLAGGSGADYIDGGPEVDTVSYSTSSFAVTINLEAFTASGGEATGDVLSSIENIIGTVLGDSIIGNFADNQLDGGAGADTLFGRSGSDVLVGGAGPDKLYGEIGNDTLLGGNDNDVLDGGAGLDVLIGGTGGDALLGGAGNDILGGEDGDDILNGGAGADAMHGGAGNDFFMVDNAGDVVTEGASEGTGDRIFASVSYVLAAGVFVEQLDTSNVAGTTAINLTGNELANSLIGNAGANILNGRGGADYMVGNGGDDTFIVDHADDLVVERSASDGLDRVNSSISYRLPAFVEQLVLTGASAIDATGNDLANTIVGNSGNNIINGKGGADYMVGNAGDDIYGVDNVGDEVVERNANDGYDRVDSSITYRLGAHLEQLVLVGSAAIDGTGNDLANFIVGNSAANVLNGKAGADYMVGNGGDDTFIVDNAGDVAAENNAGGYDRVNSSVTFRLGNNVEQLVLVGTAAINGTGNLLANTIVGNSGANVLDGAAGADYMVGNGGDDRYLIDNAADVVAEVAGGGSADRIFASVSYTLAAGVQVEQLTTNNDTATTAINLTGNELANAITGNAGNNVLKGGGGNDSLNGGAGNDTLEGGTGNDTYRFANALTAGNLDTISGYSVADDTILLEDTVFAGLALGALAAGAFNTGASASDADDRIIYNSATGAVMFDADGNGAGVAVQFATLSSGLAMAAAEFIVI